MKNLKLFFLFALLSQFIFCQNVDLPQRHQRASISQKMGLAKVTIEYSSPTLNDKPIFGDEVPFGKLWGAGKRENTTIEFSHDITLQGQQVNAGKYGLYMIPGKTEFRIILSKYNQSLSFTHPADEDMVINVAAKPIEIPLEKWLKYDFIDRKGWGTTAVLEWEKTGVPFRIEVLNPNEILLESLKSQLKGREGYLWGANYDAARFLNLRDVYLDTAMDWVDQSLNLEEESGWRRGLSLRLKAELTIKKEGYNEKAKRSMSEAVKTMKHALELNEAAHTLIKYNDLDTAEIAAKRLVEEFKDNSDIWMYMDTLAEVYLKKKNKKKALKYFELAKSKAPKKELEYFNEKIAETNNL